MEQVLVVIKPEGVKRGIVGKVLTEFHGGGLTLQGLKLVKPSAPLVKKHYEALNGKFFFKQIVDHLTGKFHDGAPVVAMVLKGPHAVKHCRKIAGATNPKEASPTSIRGKYGRINKGLFENIVHVSSSHEDAEREIKLWFKKSELVK